MIEQQILTREQRCRYEQRRRSLACAGRGLSGSDGGGVGPTLLFLHGEDGLLFFGAFLKRLAEEFGVIAPSHPGWAGSPKTERFRCLADIAYLYLDVMNELPGPADPGRRPRGDDQQQIDDQAES